MAPLVGVDPRDLASAGWGVIFPQGADPRIIEALQPLLRHRQRQAGGRYRELWYQPGESKAAFLSRHGAGPGPADPDLVPYYLLIVGDPSAIGFDFQSQLDVQYGVGRLSFEDVESYHNYANNVVAVEAGQLLTKRIAVFGVENQEDLPTHQLSQELIAPLVQRLSRLDTGWSIDSLVGQDATKARLTSLLGGEDTPSFLFIGGHGIALPRGASEQRLSQGALLCSDWRGPEAEPGLVPPTAYFGAADVDPDVDLKGLIVFAFGCFTAGTPLHDNFDLGRTPQRLADTPFVAALPQRLLGIRSGAIAYIGNIDRAWNFSWNLGPEGPQIGTYFSAIASILEGLPIGHAMGYFNHRYAELAAQMNEQIKIRESGPRDENEEIARLWYATADAQNFVVLGDPAVVLQAVPQKQEDVELAEDPVGRHREPSAPATASPRAVEASPVQSPRPRIQGPVWLGRTSGALNDKVLDRAPDYLGYSPYAKAFADLIASPHTEPPLTIGIFGDWGVGKSFLLKSIKNELASGLFAEGNREQLARVRTIEFNAWEYSAHEQIWPGLVRKILDHMEECLPGGWWRLWWVRIQRNFRRQLNKERGRILFLLVSIPMGLAIAAILAGGDLTLALQVASILLAGGALKFLGELVSNPLGSWIIKVFQSDGYGKQIGIMEAIAADLRFLGARMKSPEERILVIVDDLDRCEPDRTVEMLKAVKLLLDFDRFIVLLGIDARIVGSAVEKHYENLLGKAGATGSQYLDKIIQIPFQIPPPSDEEVEFFIYQLTERPSELAADPSGPQGKAGESLGNSVKKDHSRREEVASAAPSALASERTPVPAALTGVQEPTGSTATGVASRAAALPPPDPSFFASTETYETVDLSFSFREMRVFQQLISHVDRNPRHIKRALNIYRLVRAIAFRKQDLITLRHPEETILWVTLCLQWPQELNLILQELERLQREPGRDVPQQLAADPLPILFEQVCSQLPKGSSTSDRGRRLQWLLSDPQISRPDHLAMLRLQRYAIHTCPWEEAFSASEVNPG